MKTTTLNFLKMGLYAIMGLSVLLTSCSPEDGKDGINGIDGIDGKDGAQGPAGQDGNANVIASDWQTIKWDDGATPSFGEMSIEVKDIDLEEFIATGGVIMVYFRGINNQTSFVYTLPTTIGKVYFTFFIYTSPDIDGIRIQMTDSNNNVLTVQDNPDYMIRYVLVPANVVETNGLNLNNYKETSKLLGL
ncbi:MULTISPECIES: hypothetical protein [unclassified Allomuricauda]|uniref:hypothetical protein n=1 Tax=unclassified Allomuricauda TaxID=2615049 RepID=UPI00273EB693|nr:MULTISPECIES: hypothetical protein [unclassified Allomuricauda]